MKKIRKAVIPAAGLGTRFLPATKAQPKEMLPIVDKPTIQYIVEEAVASGIEDILIITGRGKRAIEDHFDHSVEMELFLENKGHLELLNSVRRISKMVEIHYVRQKEPLGLGHAIFCARKFVGDEPFAVMLGDDVIVSKKPCLSQLIDVYRDYQGTVVGVQRVNTAEVSKYGIVEHHGAYARTVRVKDLIEKPKPEEAPSNIAILGRYILEPEIFEVLKSISPGAGGEVQLTDALRIMVKYGNIYAHIFSGKRFDVGDKLGFLQANIEMALAREDLREEFCRYLINLASQISVESEIAVG